MPMYRVRQQQGHQHHKIERSRVDPTQCYVWGGRTLELYDDHMVVQRSPLLYNRLLVIVRVGDGKHIVVDVKSILVDQLIHKREKIDVV